MATVAGYGATWRLYAAGELVGEIEERERDFPWIWGRFRAMPSFERYRPLFDEWNRAVDADDAAAMDAAYRAIRGTVAMTYPDGRVVPEFMLGVEGDEAGFRWSDETFDR